ncbi:MAG: Holliday junction branch migration DNA helicase RuvB [Lentisphaerae bacterium]|jgi:Holliday junction DNA helicase RuvB|nr:Holliday junction branch migration DNA helicase RuvB [Lentisphaerota bacterium]
MASERFITSELNAREESFEIPLRPQRFEDFPGQERIKERLLIMTQAAKSRSEPMSHVLLCGPPGLGKTTLANIIANYMGADIKTTSGPVIEKPGDLAGLLTSLKEGDILFIDEIHRLPMHIEEYLYSAMEDFVIDIMLEQGVGARSVRLTLPKFTLIGATTRQGKLSSPLRSRFNMTCRLDYYTIEDLTKILTRTSNVLGVRAQKEGLDMISRRARGTPRIANQLVRWVRDFIQVKNIPEINPEIADEALTMLDIDIDGLDDMDNRILEAMIVKFKGHPVGLKSLAVAVGEEESTIEEVYEPYLIQEGYLMRTPAGRLATDKAFKRFGIIPTASHLHKPSRDDETPTKIQPELF